MSDKEIIGTTESREPTAPGPTAEAKRIAARRRFLARGVGGAGFAILTLAHQRSDAWYSSGGYTKNPDHILSLPYSYTSGTKAAADCHSFNPNYRAYKGTYEGQSPGNMKQTGADVWYCGPGP